MFSVTTGTISPERKQAFCAARARLKLSSAKRSTSSRVILYWRATFSAVSSHREARRGIEQRFPEEIFEFDLAHAESAAMGEGCDGIAAHGFGADAEREIDFFQGDGVGGLADGFHAGAADALDKVRGTIGGNAGVEADVAREHVGIEAGLRDAAGDGGVNVGGRDFGAFENGASGFDAEVNRRDQAEDAIVIGEGSANAVEEPDVVVLDEKTA